MGAAVWTVVGVTALGFWTCHLRLRSHRPSRPVPDGADLGPYAYAYLSGGPGRTARTALTALHRAGLVTVVEKRVVRRDGPAPAVPGDGRVPDPVETAALALCRPGRGAPGTRTEDRVAKSRAVRRLGVSLAEAGLLPHPGRAARREGWESAVQLAGPVALFLGEIALFTWGSGDRPDAGWVASVSSALGLLSLVSLRFARFRPRPLTEAGEGLLKDFPPGAFRTRVDGTLYEVAAGGAGAAAVPEELRRALRRPDPSYTPDNDPPGLGGAGF
ncbi:TIGR04222 domain-containing membrane protein [Streptomyces sp. NPDC012825]|uniref:TIGR04222 domain-containing membrane protein n=1 Tax=Streptomyces sp. NPDC012825 TaxID=3364851 RepID=UPI0036CA80A5